MGGDYALSQLNIAVCIPNIATWTGLKLVIHISVVDESVG